MSESRECLIETLTNEMSLSPYEARAYVAVLFDGPLSPKGVNQKAGIPRPRTYDVLTSLVGKGLLMEQPGKPSRYLAVDPQAGLKKLMEEEEKKVLRQVQQKWGAIEALIPSLSEAYSISLDAEAKEDSVWVARKDRAMVAKYTEAIRNVETEFTLATALRTPPTKDVLDAVKYALKHEKTSRVVRPIEESWPREHIKEYLDLIHTGDQIRRLDYDGLSFAVFDRQEVILWIPPHPSKLTVWIRLPQLADILMERFENLWKMASPAEPYLEELLKRP
ncbi:MAG: TrmB family transcriptional regulator [Candidatus Thorarchaeota archaeon]|nr:TrmB family transcriptional regulator [Candidatus Thorarchaeota archaeon]